MQGNQRKHHSSDAQTGYFLVEHCKGIRGPSCLGDRLPPAPGLILAPSTENKGDQSPGVFRISLSTQQRLQPQGTCPSARLVPHVQLLTIKSLISFHQAKPLLPHLQLSSRMSSPSRTTVTLQSQTWISAQRPKVTTPHLKELPPPFSPHRNPVLPAGVF